LFHLRQGSRAAAAMDYKTGGREDLADRVLLVERGGEAAMVYDAGLAQRASHPSRKDQIEM